MATKKGIQSEKGSNAKGLGAEGEESVELPRFKSATFNEYPIGASGKFTLHRESLTGQNESAKFHASDVADSTFPWAHAATRGAKISIFMGLMLRSLGVIYGDIGTSPLYVMSTMFPKQPENIDDYIGGCSLVLWSIIILVLVKYVCFILLADNHGEGGTLSLGNLLLSERSSLSSPLARNAVRVAMMIAAALLLADGAFTPAISVSSAVGGIALYAKSLTSWIVPISVVIIVILFALQRFGTSKIGVVFGPLVLLWFLCIFAGGVYNVISAPRAFEAFNPWLGIKFLFRENTLVTNVTGANGTLTTQTTHTSNYPILGSVFLAVTGLEALFADMGHFSAWPIRVSFVGIVMPSLLMSYIGQTAFLLLHPDKSATSFYSSFPPWALWPMIVMATLATIIASQAIITGAYSLTRQGSENGLIPPITIKHSSKKVEGQIYVPVTNLILLVLCLFILIVFTDPEALTSAYGVAVITESFVMTIFYIVALVVVFKRHVALALLFCAFFVVDVLFLGAVYTKVPTGGWVTLTIAAVFSVVLLAWFYGEAKLREVVKRTFEGFPIPDLARFLITPSTASSDTTTSPSSEDRASRKKGKKHRRSSKKKSRSKSKSRDKDANKELLKPENEDSKKMPHKIHVDSENKAHVDSDSSAEDEGVVIVFQSQPISVSRRPGMAVFTCHSLKQTPASFENFIHTLKFLSQHLLFVKVEHVRVATVSRDRTVIRTFPGNVNTMRIFVGFADPVPVLMNEINSAIKEGYLPEIKPEDIFAIDGVEVVELHRHKNIFKRAVLLLYEQLKSAFPLSYAKNLKMDPKQTMHVDIRVTL